MKIREVAIHNETMLEKLVLKHVRVSFAVMLEVGAKGGRGRPSLAKILLYGAVISAGLLIFTSSPSFAAILTHGPVVGGVTPSEAKVFVRTDRTASVQIQFSPDPNLANASVTSSLQTSSISDFTAIVPLTGLSPQTTYYLNVAVNGVPQLSPSFPSFSTFPATTDPQPFKFIILTDFTRQDRVTLAVPTFLNASDEQAAFTVIGGDFDHRNPFGLSAKRTMFKQLYDPNSVGLADFVNRILRKMPIVHQWDDHDAGKNNIDKTYPQWNLSYQAFVEYVPIYEAPLTPPGIWQRFSYGHVDFFVLDNRSQRDPNTDPDDDNKGMLDGNNLGATGQLEWLKNGLLGSSARWKVVFSSVPTNPTTKPSDSWGAFQIEWGKIRTLIETNGITGVVFISGDLHMGAIDNGNAAGFPEMVVPTANGAAQQHLCSGNPGVWSQGVYKNPTGYCDGYGVVTVLTNPDQLLLEVKDENGAVRLSFTVF